VTILTGTHQSFASGDELLGPVERIDEHEGAVQRRRRPPRDAFLGNHRDTGKQLRDAIQDYRLRGFVRVGDR